MPAPLKYTFKEGLEKVLEKHRIRTGRRLCCYFPMGGSGNAPFGLIGKAEKISDVPDMVLSSAFDSLFEKYFFERYINKGYFQSCQKKPLPPIYAECGMEDPKKNFTIAAVVPIVMLVDRKKLGGLPAPKRWDDILDPVYRRKIIFGGWRKSGNIPYSEFNTLLLFDVYKNHGSEGLKCLARNTKDLIHYVQMSRIAGTDSGQGAAIYIMPWFLADICPRRESTAVIWPEDGALAFPIYFLAKKTELEKMKPLIDYVTGEKLGQYLADNCYPSLNPRVNYRFPSGAKLKWIGWNYIYSNNVPEEMRTAAGIFFNNWRQ